MKMCLACGFETEENIAACPKDATPLTGGDPFLGTIFLDKYQIIEVLGRGGMSAVYKARHMLMGRFVAIKLLRGDLLSDTKMLRRFQQESKAVSKLNHPNVLSAHDFGLTPDAVPYLIMDFLEGKTLDAILKQHRWMQPDRVVDIFSQLCSALSHAHANGIVHRDIKPSNIMLVPTGGDAVMPKIVDFGIAKMLTVDNSDGTGGGTEEKMSLTTTGEVFGSALYMAPEQCKAGKIDGRTDIYALGSVIYECLLGRPAICGATPMDTMVRQLTDYPVPFREARPDLQLPDALETVVMRALEKDKEDRFQSMPEFGSALLQAMSGYEANPRSQAPYVSSGTTAGRAEDFEHTQAGVAPAWDGVVDKTQAGVVPGFDPSSLPPWTGDMERLAETQPDADADIEDDLSALPAWDGTTGQEPIITGNMPLPEPEPSLSQPQKALPPPPAPKPTLGTMPPSPTGRIVAPSASTSAQSPVSEPRSETAARQQPLSMPASYDLLGNEIVRPAAPDRVNDRGDLRYTIEPAKAPPPPPPAPPPPPRPAPTPVQYEQSRAGTSPPQNDPPAEGMLSGLTSRVPMPLLVVGILVVCLLIVGMFVGLGDIFHSIFH